jgi:hypothetical protein
MKARDAVRGTVMDLLGFDSVRFEWLASPVGRSAVWVGFVRALGFVFAVSLGSLASQVKAAEILTFFETPA